MLRKYEHISGPSRTALRDSVVERYRRGDPIREIASDLGRSYGFVHKLILESGTEFRSRGVRRRKNSAAAAAAAAASAAAAEMPGQMETEMDLGAAVAAPVTLTGVVIPEPAAQQSFDDGDLLTLPQMDPPF